VGGPNRARTPIFSIGFMGFGSAGLPGLERLSRGTGAEMIELRFPADFDEVFEEISSRMNQSFVVSYPIEPDGVQHTVEVRFGGAHDTRRADYPGRDDGDRRWAAAAISLLLAGSALFAAIRSRNLRPSGELVITTGAQAHRSFSLHRRSIDIGALDNNDIVLNIASVSRHHARLTFEARGTQLEDLRSRNGTFINDRQMFNKGSIRHGDRIRFGEVELIFRA
jgi:hypothetical protein